MRKSILSLALAAPSLVTVVTTALAMVSASNAFALTELRQVQVSNGSRVDLLFDGKVSRSQIKTEFFRDIIQISLNNVSVYPAKIASVSGGVLTKIFAYQYAPKLVRCRLSVKGNADSFKNRIFISSGGPNGTLLTIRLGTNAASASPHSGNPGNPGNIGAPVVHGSAEQELLDHVIQSKDPGENASDQQDKNDATDTITEKAAAPAPSHVLTTSNAAAANAGGIANTESHPLNLDSKAPATSQIGGASDFPSPLSALAKLALVIGLFVAIAWAMKKFLKSDERPSEDNAFLGKIGRFARKSLGTNVSGAKKVPIEVLNTHHLGPKKSIAVIKVGSRTMVVGITEQSINLISQVAPQGEEDEDAMNALAELDNPPLDDAVKTPDVFSKLLRSETTKPAISAPVANTKLAATTARRNVQGDVRVTSYGSSSAGAPTPPAAPTATTESNTAPSAADSANVTAQAAIGLSGVRAQIRNKLEGFKQI